MEQSGSQINFDEQETADTGITSFNIAEIGPIIEQLDAHVSSSIQLTEKRTAHLHGAANAVEGWTGYIPDPRSLRILKLANALKDIQKDQA